MKKNLRSYLLGGMFGIISFCWLCLIPGLVMAQPPNLIFNGDFETPSSADPPSGWAMWGNRAYKNPNHFIRDTLNPHGGKASLRIYHPAGTDGYIVTSPERAIRPVKAKRYLISFWAKTDKPGRSLLGVDAYASINPFVEAPSPGSFPFEANREWKRFSFEIKEGFEFSADRSRYLLLAFKATTIKEEEKNLWVDDIVVNEADNPQAAGLIDEKSLVYKRLQHWLKPGQELSFTVDAQKHLRQANRVISGISFHRLTGHAGGPLNQQGHNTLSPELERAIRDLHLPMTRIYGLGNEPFGLETAIDKAAELAKKLGIPQSRIVLECEAYKSSEKISPAAWARAVRHSLKKGYGFQYWEVANEPEVASRQSGKKAAFATADEYIEHLKAVSKAVKSVQPKAQIGVSIADTPVWGNNILNRAAGSYNFVVSHYYAFIDAYRRKFEVVTLSENYKILDQILKTNALIKAYNPNREAYQLDTEWGLSSNGPNNTSADFADRNGNIMGTLHRAVRLIYYAHDDFLRGASSWEMLCRLNEQGFGILSLEAPEKRFLIYWLYYYFNRHLGEWILDMEGTSPYYYPAAADHPSGKPAELAGPLTPVLATQSKDKKHLYLVMANGSWDRSIPCRAKVANFKAARAEGILLTHSNLDGKPLLQRKEEAVTPLSVSVTNQEVTCTLPPHSVVFITIKGN